MICVKELYDRFEERIPPSLREAWDNDGLMLCADGSALPKRVLVTLDVTEEIVDYAIESDFDLIISHHSLIFRPLGSITEDNHISRKIIKLLANGISVFSFHTRADKVTGGVNDALCDLIGILDTKPYGEGELGRIGNIEATSLEDFAARIKLSLGADAIRYADALNTVNRVAVVGGDGKDYVKPAILEGADTFVSGRIGYNMMEEAAEMGINLIEAGHYFTEQPVTEFFRSIVMEYSPDSHVEIAVSNNIKTI